MTITEKFIKTILKHHRLTRDSLSILKRRFAADFAIPLPANSELLQSYHNLASAGKIKKNETLERILKKREIRTLSGVAPIAVLTKPYPCPGQCVYCPTEKNMPKSYLSNEPAVMRAILNKFDPYKQVQMRLQALKANGHETDKCELIIMGGTWSCLPKSYQTNFIKRCFQAFNTNSYKFTTNNDKLQIPREIRKIRNSYPFVKNSLPFVLKKNEQAKHRVVGLTLETRPDYINKEEIIRMRQLGCTRVELGVQSIYDDILKLNQRGCTRQQIIDATRLLKNAGLKITYHLMPNLPGSNPKRDLKMFKEIFSSQTFQPDQIKIYPCVITKNSKLYNWYKAGKYKPYTQTRLINLLVAIKKIVPPYVRITRLIRDIPAESIIAGNKISNLRQIIQSMSDKKQRDCHAPRCDSGLAMTKVESCKCIRCREIRGTNYKMSDIKLIKREYAASNGQEIFLSYEDVKQNKLVAFLRLRFPTLNNQDIPLRGITRRVTRYNNQKKTNNQNPSDQLLVTSDDFLDQLLVTSYQLPILKNTAIIRELHTYGTMIPIGQSGKVQHHGFGKKLLAEAEKLARQAGYKKLAVISGIGVRDYYRKLGYKLQNEYMVKNLTKTKNRPKIKS